MINLIVTILIIFSVLIAWVLIQQVARKYAADHPEMGPVKEEGLGCGKTCGCKTSCKKEDSI